MKKALAIFMGLALVGTAFAVDVKASLRSQGSIYGTNGIDLSGTDTQDEDNLVFSVDGKNAGALFKMHTNYNDNATVLQRKGKIWFKPVDQLKFTVGNTDWALTKEQIDWWRGTSGKWANDWNNNDNIDTQTSFLAEITPVAGLNLMAGVDDVMKTSDDGKSKSFANVTPYAVGGKYEITGVGIIGAAYKHTGTVYDAAGNVTADTDLIRASFEVTAIKDLKAFAKLTLRQDIVGTESKKLNGIGVDLYGAYTADKFNIKALVPVVYRLDTDNKSTSLYYDVRAQYALTGFTPYIRLRDAFKLSGDVATDKTVDNQAINPDILIAATWSIDIANFDVGFEYLTPVSGGDGVWKLPFTVRVNY